MATVGRQARSLIGTVQGRNIVSSFSPGSLDSAIAKKAASGKPIVGPTEPTHPIHLFTEVFLNSGAEQAIRSQALSNRTGRPVDIREIRFGVLAGADLRSDFNFFDLGGVVGVSLAVDGLPITNSYVPIWNLGKTEDYSGQTPVSADGTNITPWCQYVWRLSRPWRLRPGAEVTAQFRHTGATRFGATAQIGLAGATARGGAASAAVPYACSWASKPVLDTDTALEESMETDLLNITKRTVMVDRIIGRIATRFTTTIGGHLYTIYDDVYSWATEFGGLELKIFTSDHRPILPDYLGVSETFGPRRAIEIAHPFAPGDFYRATLRKRASFSTNATDYYSQAFVSAVGWREEPIR